MRRRPKQGGFRVSIRLKPSLLLAALVLAGAGLWLAVAGGLIDVPPEQRVIRAFILAAGDAAQTPLPERPFVSS